MCSLLTFQVLEFSTYRELSLFWCLCDQLVSGLWSGCSVSSSSEAGEWPGQLQEWLRTADEAVLQRVHKVLNIFQEDLVPAQGELFIR